jgi:23S rRNA pseudouridine1911/1915/1917 synthase
MPVDLEVPPDSAGMRLDRFLAEPLGSRAKAQSLIDAELVRVNGRVRPKRHVVRAGERIEVDDEPPPVVEPSEAPFRVVEADE